MVKADIKNKIIEIVLGFNTFDSLTKETVAHAVCLLTRWQREKEAVGKVREVVDNGRNFTHAPFIRNCPEWIADRSE